MNEKITPLLKVQEIDRDLHRLQKTMGAIAPDREAFKEEIQRLSKEFESSKDFLKENQLKRKSLELDIETKEQAINKNNSELNSVKTNEAYKALLKQIEEAKKSKSDLEDQVLELMESMEKLQHDSKEKEKKLEEEKVEIEKKISTLDQEERSLKEKHEAKMKERDDFFEKVSADMQHRYTQIQRGRSEFMVMAPVREMTCGGCQTSIPASVVNDVMKGKELFSCENCSRLLFIPSTEPVSPES